MGAEPPAPAAPAKGEFLIGADFDPQASEQVKALFYESGMNCIRLTGGGYAWSAAMHKKLADEFAARGLKVYLQLGSHYPSADYFARKDAWMVDHAGQSGVEDRRAWAISYSGKNWPQYSYASEPFRRQLEGDFAAYLKPFAGNANVAGVILHNEPGLFWMTDRVFDYSPVSIARFGQWLKQRHGTIQTLNGRWGSSFASFEQVTPPGKPPVPQSIGAWLDWRRFQVAIIADFLTWEAEFFKKQRPDVARSTNLAGPLDHWYGYRCADNYAHSAMMDRVGIDLYPTQWTDRAFLPYSMDMTQGVAQGRDAHVHECDVFSAKLWKQYSDEQRAELLRGELWTLIGHGARAVLMWGFTRNDDFSLTNGEYNQRLLACRDIAYMARMLRIGEFVRPWPQVALCVDPDSYLYIAGIEPKPLHLTPTEDTEAHGLYAALADARIPTDVILTPQLRAGAWRNYRAIVLAGARLMDEQTASQLEQFVSSGGLLIADAPLAQMDRWGKRPGVVPGSGLDRVFGIRSTQAQSPNNWFTITAGQTKITATPAVEKLELRGAQAIGTLADGTPGLTSNTHGKGRAVFLNGRVGIPYVHNPEPGLRNWLTAIVGPVVHGPRLRLTPAAAQQLDASTLQDSRGNLLVVVTNLGDKGKLPPAVAQVQLDVATDHANGFRSVFILPPTRTHNGAVTSGPRPAKPVPSSDGKSLAIPLGQITSAMPVLLAQDAGPLLSIDAPAHAKPGQQITITVTCHNPSPRALSGRIVLRVGPGQAEAGKSEQVTVEPFAQQALRLPLQIPADAKPGRMGVTAVLTAKTHNGEAIGIPVDIQID